MSLRQTTRTMVQTGITTTPHRLPRNLYHKRLGFGKQMTFGNNQVFVVVMTLNYLLILCILLAF